MIERAYTLAEQMGIAVWCQDEAGPFSPVPYPGESWHPQQQPDTYPHEYFREGTAKVLTLFHPKDGQVRIKGVESCPNAVLHPWLKQELAAIAETLPDPIVAINAGDLDPQWQQWREGLSAPFPLPEALPPLKMLLVCDNLAGHKSPELVLWLCAHGILPLYTPLGGSWLNMAESIQRILKRRALSGQHPQTPQEIMRWFEEVAQAWNRRQDLVTTNLDIEHYLAKRTVS
ncbi:MAG: transposase [Synechococcales bacterium]|nr:transposase [Synechococcales bacterium]